MQVEPRGGLRARPPARRRAPGLRHEPARDHRRDAARLGTRDAGGAGGGAPARLPAAVRGRAFPPRVRARRRQVSLPRRDWPNTPYANDGLRGPWRGLPSLPDHWPVNEGADAAHPFKLATSQARNFLNSSFNQTATSLAREGRPSALMHPHDMAELGLNEGDVVRLGNARGVIRVHVRPSAGATRGVIVSEGLWDNRDFLDGRGVNTLTGADSVAPFGGAAFHDIRVWARADVEGAAEEAKAAAEAAT